MEFTVEIGENEKQLIFFSFNKFWGNLKILVNEKKVISDFLTFSRGLIRSYEFKVGTNETHEIKIEKIRPQLLAGIRTNTYKVYVDGNLFRQFKD